MWRLTPIETGHELSGLRNIADGHGDSVIPNFIRLLAKSTASATAYFQAENALANGQLGAAQREKIALAVAAINGSKYCLASHERAGRLNGLSAEEIRSARNASAGDAKTQVMLRFVQALVLQRGEISDGDFSAMRRAGYSDGEIIEVLANVVLNIFTNYFNILAQTDMDVPVDAASLKTAAAIHG